MPAWNFSDIPDLAGRTALVTGGNVGLGFRSALELARKGAAVFIACRNIQRGHAAADRIWAEVPSTTPTPVELDLTDPEKHHALRRRCVLEHRPARHPAQQRRRGELRAHGAPVPAARRDAGRARVVTLTSQAWRSGTIDFDDLDWRRRPYSRGKSYGDSKLANLLFMRALQTRFDDAGAEVLSLAAHPGLTGTERQQSIGVGGLLATRKLSYPNSHRHNRQDGRGGSSPVIA